MSPSGIVVAVCELRTGNSKNANTPGPHFQLEIKGPNRLGSAELLRLVHRLPASPGKLASEEPGFVLTAGGWKVVGDRLFALASATSVTGFENSERTSFRARPDREHRFRKRERRGRFAREVRPDGSLGNIFCINQTPSELDDLAFQAAESDDPAYALRCGQQEWHIPRSEVRGRGGGGQYPSGLVHSKHLYVLYSMGKEDVWISRVPLADLGCAE